MRAQPVSREPVLVGLVGAVAAVVLRRLGFDWWDVSALVSLLVLLPVLSVLQVRALADTPIERVPAYVSSIVSLLVLGGAAWLVGRRHGGNAALGLVPLPWGQMAAWTGGLVVAGLVATVAFRFLATALGLGESPLLRALLPRTAREKSLFAVLSLSAGVGEELAYRGYVIGALTGVMGGAGAGVVSSLVFGVLHVYQGVLGMMRTAVLGGILAGAFIVSGSLWPAMAAHAILDVLLGIFLAERMMVPEPDIGVPTEESP